MKKIISTFFLVLLVILGYGQGSEKVEMADALRSSGKIYVVVSVIAVIFLGIATYLIYMERRISKLEKEQK